MAGSTAPPDQTTTADHGGGGGGGSGSRDSGPLPIWVGKCKGRACEAWGAVMLRGSGGVALRDHHLCAGCMFKRTSAGAARRGGATVDGGVGTGGELQVQGSQRLTAPEGGTGGAQGRRGAGAVPGGAARGEGGASPTLSQPQSLAWIPRCLLPLSTTNTFCPGVCLLAPFLVCWRGDGRVRTMSGVMRPRC
eukprot:COSAG01_NODE_7752_length_3070_cov_15.026927_4_plen_192_part_00